MIANKAVMIANTKVARFRELMDAKKSIEAPATKDHARTGKENRNNSSNGNYAAMRRIMKRKEETAKQSHKRAPVVAGSSNSSLSDDDESFAMMGGEINNTTMDHEEPSEIAITPAQWRCENRGDMNGSSSGDGASGVLSFLGESPLFDQSVADSKEAEKNLTQSAEKIKRFEERMLIRDEFGFLSPVRGEDETRGVRFADENGFGTPREANTKSYPKSPYIPGGKLTTPSKSGELSESIDAKSNLNESVLVSDDEMDDDGDDNGGEFSTPFKSSSAKSSSANDETTDSGEFGTPRSRVDQSILSRNMSYRRNKPYSPTREELVERNQTLVKEVRFADQTCVELSERKKFYKNQVGQYRRDVKAANDENVSLRGENLQLVQDNAKLKVLVESLRVQNTQAGVQAEEYKARIIEMESTHRTMVKNMEGNFNALNSRLQETLAKGNVDCDAATLSLQNSVKELQAMYDQQTAQLQRERNERDMIENDRDHFQNQCDELHKQLTTWAQSSDALVDVFHNEDGSQNEDFAGATKLSPVKQLRLYASSDEEPRTPTANLLSRTLRSELKNRQKVVRRLELAENRVKELESHVSTLKMDLEEHKADNALLVEDAEDYTSKIRDLESLLADKDAQVASLHEEIEVMCQESVEDESNSTTPEADETDEESDTKSKIKERLHAAEETLDFADDELAETRAKLAETEKLLYQTADELEKSEGELDSAREIVSKYKAQVGKLKRDLSQKETENAEESHFSDFQSSTLEIMKGKLAKSNRVNDEQRRQLDSCIKSLMSLEKILANFERSDSSVAQAKFGEYMSKISSLAETVRVIQDNVASTSSTNGNMVEQLRAEMASTKSILANVKLERDEAKAQLEETVAFSRRQEDEHSEETSTLRKLCTDLELKLAEASAGAEVSTRKIEALTKEVSIQDTAVVQQLSVATGSNSELIRDNEKLRVDLQSAELKLEDERSLVRATREEADGYRTDVSNAKKAFEIVSAESDLRKASLSKLQDELESLHETSNILEKDLARTRQDLLEEQESAAEQTKSLETRIADLQSTLVENESALNDAVESLRSSTEHVASLERAVADKENQCLEKHNECQELIVEVKKLQHHVEHAEADRAKTAFAVESLETDISEKKTLIFTYEESIIQYKNEIRMLTNELQTTVQEKNNRIQMLEKAVSDRQALFDEQLDRTKRDRDASTSEMTSMISRLQNELRTNNATQQHSDERTKAIVKELEGELEAQVSAKADLSRLLDEKQTLLDDQDKDLIDLQTQLRQARGDLTRLSNTIDATEMDRERIIAAHEDEIEEVMAQRDRATGELAQLEEKLNDLQYAFDQSEAFKLNEYPVLTHENAILQKKCTILKQRCHELTEKTMTWEEAYKQQGNDLVQHSIEISRLKSQLLAATGQHPTGGYRYQTPHVRGQNRSAETM